VEIGVLDFTLIDVGSFWMVLIWVTKVGDGAGGGDGMAKRNWWRDERMLLEYGMKLKRKKKKKKKKNIKKILF
jgi:hypothetical protein